MRAIYLLASLMGLAACGEKEPDDSAAEGPPDADADGFTIDDDCDDNDPSVYPGAAELCDGRDNNCDDEIDEGVTLTVYADSDGDGVGDAETSAQACALEEGWSELAGDCDDARAEVYPGAAEVCDGLDNDCDGQVDGEGAADPQTFYADSDGDGFGDPELTTLACEGPPSGFVALGTDCDDARADVHPGAEELCDGLDNDCDGQVTEVLVPADYAGLQDALDAGEGDICLAAGSYPGGVSHSMVGPLSIRGVGSADVVLDGGGATWGLSIVGNGDELRISGLSIVDAWSDLGVAAGLSYQGRGLGSVTLEDIVIEGSVCAGETCNGGSLLIDGYNHAELIDVEVSGGQVGALPMGSVALLDGRSLVMDGVSIHDERVDVGEGQGLGSVLRVENSSVNSTGLYNSTVSINDLQITDNVTTSADTVRATAILVGIGDLDVTNTRVAGNTMSVGDFCAVPGLLPFEVIDGAYRNLEIVGNRCDAGGSGLAPGFCHYGRDGGRVAGSVATVENVIIAGNTLNATTDVFSASVIDYYTRSSYVNVSVHGNTGSAATGYAGWLLLAHSNVNLENVDYSDNHLLTSVDPLFATGFGDLSLTSTLDVRYSNLIDLGDTPFSSIFNDPRGTNGVIEVDPGYVDVSDADPLNWDLTLSSSSALIDAGDPSVQDPDGSVSDVGAWGGPGAADW